MRCGDAPHLIGVQLKAGPELQKYGGGGRPLIAGEQAPFGHDDMHSSIQHPVDLPYGARQLTLQGHIVAHLAIKVRRAQGRLQKHLEAHDAAAGQALPGQHEASLVDEVVGHHQRRTVVGQSVRNSVVSEHAPRFLRRLPGSRRENSVA